MCELPDRFRPALWKYTSSGALSYVDAALMSGVSTATIGRYCNGLNVSAKSLDKLRTLEQQLDQQ